MTIYIFIYSSTYLSIDLSINVSIDLNIDLSNFLYIYLTIYLSIYLSVYLFTIFPLINLCIYPGLSNLEELHLEDNLLSSISNITFLALKSLQILNLQGKILSFCGSEKRSLYITLSIRPSVHIVRYDS